MCLDQALDKRLISVCIKIKHFFILFILFYFFYDYPKNQKRYLTTYRINKSAQITNLGGQKFIFTNRTRNVWNGLFFLKKKP
jgi:hypothetical protein